MKYQKVRIAKFLSRPNRFIAEVELDGRIEIVHVKNTGRCKELLIPGARVFLSDEMSEKRKTRYDLIAVEKVLPDGTVLLINLDSQAPNQVAFEFFRSGDLFSDSAEIHREVKFGNSRFDFAIDDKGKRTFVEVKGVTLENEGVVLFPDAPTERGVKHIRELIEAKKMGFGAMVFFVIQLKGVKYFSPNDKTHKEFGAALREADREGVVIRAFDCEVTKDSLKISRQVEIKL